MLAVTSAGRRFAAAAEPLIAQANAAREDALSERAQHTLRVGVPAGHGPILNDVAMTAIAREVRRSFPETRLVRQDIPFSELTRCLPEHRVDILWTAAPVRHPAVTSIPLDLTSPRIGVVAARHAFADAQTMDVEEFSQLPILCNSAVPNEWMNQFWLGDMRPRHEAQLVETDAVDTTHALRRTAAGDAALVIFAEFATVLDPSLRAVVLTGAAAPVRFYAAHRRPDRRGAVHALLRAFQALGHRLL
jgi:hypothetical protein